MTHYHRWPISQLPQQVGIDAESGGRIARHVEGFVSYGPYCRLEPGRYFGGFHVQALDPSVSSEALQLSVRGNKGADAIADRSVSGRELFSTVPGLVGVDFKIEQETSDIEVRLHVSEAVAVEVRSLVIFRNEPV